MEFKQRYSTREVIDAMARLLTLLDGSDRKTLSDEESLVLLRDARRVVERASALTDVMTVEVDQKLSAPRVHGKQLTDLLTDEEHLDAGRAAGTMRRARSVARDPKTAQDVIAGRFSAEHARDINRALDSMPKTLTSDEREAARDELARRAESASPSEVRKAADDVVEQVAPDKARTAQQKDQILAEQRRRAFARRSLTIRPAADEPGSWYLRGLLPDLEASQLVTAINMEVAAAKRRDRDAGIQGVQPTREQRQADALVLLARTSGVGNSLNPSTSSGRFDKLNEPGNSERFDKLNEPADPERFDTLNEPADAERFDTLNEPPRRVSKPVLVVTVSYETLARDMSATGLLPTGQKISGADLRRIACDSDIIPVVLGTKSEILDVGRAERLVTPAIRTALTLRDKGCIFPGCAVPAEECEAHHAIPWWAGGVTSLRNLALLCPHHHAWLEPIRTTEGKLVSKWGWHIDFDEAGIPKVKRTKPPRTTPPGTQPPNGPPQSVPQQAERPTRIPTPGAEWHNFPRPAGRPHRFTRLRRSQAP